MSAAPRTLEELIAEARERYRGLPRTQQIALDRQTKISWVWGEMRLRGHDITRERIAEIVAQQEAAARHG